MSVALGVIPRTAGPDEALKEALAAHARGAPCAIATVVTRQGSAPCTPGQKLALWRDSERLHAVGTVGGGAVERAVIVTMLDTIEGRGEAPRLHTFRLGPELGMCCGGSADILVELLRPARVVLLVGAGHVGMATARLLPALGFRSLLADARPEATLPERAREVEAMGVTVLAAEHDDPEVVAALGVEPSGAAMIVMTHDHRLDQGVIEWALKAGFALVAGVGSRAKAVRTKQRLEAKGFSATDVERVKMPVGMAIGARTPEEIAISIAGELVAWRSEAARTAARPARPKGDAPAASARARTNERLS
jgi:xanthine dehydrogenase accessory factor